jgi:hypothetical protein
MFVANINGHQATIDAFAKCERLNYIAALLSGLSDATSLVVALLGAYQALISWFGINASGCALNMPGGSDLVERRQPAHRLMSAWFLLLRSGSSQGGPPELDVRPHWRRRYAVESAAANCGTHICGVETEGLGNFEVAVDLDHTLIGQDKAVHVTSNALGHSVENYRFLTSTLAATVTLEVRPNRKIVHVWSSWKKSAKVALTSAGRSVSRRSRYST